MGPHRAANRSRLAVLTLAFATALFGCATYWDDDYDDWYGHRYYRYAPYGYYGYPYRVYPYGYAHRHHYWAWRDHDWDDDDHDHHGHHGDGDHDGDHDGGNQSFRPRPAPETARDRRNWSQGRADGFESPRGGPRARGTGRGWR